MGDVLTRHGISYFGGKCSPYLWMRCPNGMGSWEFFDALLSGCEIVGTPAPDLAHRARAGSGLRRLASARACSRRRSAWISGWTELNRRFIELAVA